jgi:hypothetical protein
VWIRSAARLPADFGLSPALLAQRITQPERVHPASVGGALRFHPKLGSLGVCYPQVALLSSPYGRMLRSDSAIPERQCHPRSCCRLCWTFPPQTWRRLVHRHFFRKPVPHTDLPFGRPTLHAGAMPDHRFRTLERLIQQANQTSPRKPDSVEMLATVIRLVTDDGADPYVILGVLVESAAHTIAKHIPSERQVETTEELGRLLVERLKAHGLM